MKHFLRTWTFLCVVACVVSLPWKGARAQQPADWAENQYMVIELRALPTASERAELEAEGVFLLEHVSGTSYYAKITPRAKARLKKTEAAGSTVFSFGKRTHDGAEQSFRAVREDLSSKLLADPMGEIPPHARAGADRAKVAIRFRPETPKSVQDACLAGHSVTISYRVEKWGAVEGVMPVGTMAQLASQPFVASVNFIAPLPELYNQAGRKQIGAETLSRPGAFDVPQGLEGNGVTVAIFDGNVKPHVDLEASRIHIEQANMEEEHGQHVAGTVAASGKFQPRAKGMAPKVNLWTANFNNPAPEMADLMRRSSFAGAILSQNSYGVYMKEGYCNYRTSSSYIGYNQYLDRLALDQPEYGLIYAAGNDQGACDPHGTDEMARYQTMSRVEKNVITVAAIDSLGQITNFSSFGPLCDGRMAPLISAQGKAVYSTVYNNGYQEMDGTSMACPTVSGLTALLYELYRVKNSGKNPNFVLIKSILLNTATEAGRPGPDYQYGYGIASGTRAAKVIVEKQFHENSLSHEEEKTFQVDVPSGLSAAKFMLVWHDAPGFKAGNFMGNLKDDLDLTVQGPGGEHLPWKLDPNGSNRLNPATRGENHLDNHEQVQIDLPQAGKYTIKVKGTKLSSPTVKYALSWDFVTQAPNISYPNGGEILELGSEVIVRWHPGGCTGSASIKIKPSTSSKWQELTTVDDVTQGWARVTLPMSLGVSSTARIKIESAGLSDESDRDFQLTPRLHLYVNFDPCAEKPNVLLWDAVQGVTEYELLKWDPNAANFTHHSYVTGTRKELEGQAGTVAFFSLRAKIGSDYGPMTPPFKMRFVEKAAPITFPRKIDAWNDPAKVQIKQGSHVLVGGWGENKKLACQGWTITQEVYDQYDRYKADVVGVPEHQQFVLHIATCLDLTEVSGGDISVTVPIELKYENRNETASRVSYMLDGSGEWSSLSDRNGEASSWESKTRYYTLPQGLLGRKVALGVQLLAIQPSSIAAVGVIEVRKISSSGGAPAVDVGISELVLPKPGYLTTTEKIAFTLTNHSDQEQTVSCKMFNGSTLVAKGDVPVEGLRSKTVSANGIDLSQEETKFEIRATVSCAGDSDPSNNELVGYAYNLAPYYCMPSVEGSIPVKDISENPSNPLKFADDGGSLLPYTPDEERMVHFKPYSGSTKVMLKFTEIDLADGDELIVGQVLEVNGEVTYQTAGYIKGGETYTLPLTFAGTRENGGTGELAVLFSPRSGNSVKNGWKAEVSEVGKDEPVDASANTLSLTQIELDRSSTELPNGLATVKVAIRNNTDVDQTVDVRYAVNGGTPVEQTMTITPGEATYSFTKQADLKEHPRQHKIEVQIDALDINPDDNYGSREFWSDLYVVTEFAPQDEPSFQLEKLVTSATYVATTAQTVFPNYQRFTEVHVAQGESLSLHLLNRKATSGAYAYVWVDVNNDRNYSPSEKLSKAIENSAQSTWKADLSSLNLEEGTYYMRVALANTSTLSMDKEDWRAFKGVVYDFMLRVEATTTPVSPINLKIESTSNGSLNVSRQGESLQDGSELHVGEILSIAPIPDGGYQLDELSVTGAEELPNNTWRVQSNVTEVRVKASFKLEPVQEFTVTYEKIGNGTLTVMNGSTAVESGTKVKKGTNLTITAQPEPGHTAELRVDGALVSSPAIHVVQGDCHIKATFIENGTPTPVTKYKITFSAVTNGRLEVRNNGEIISSGDEVEEGSSLSISAKPNDGYELEALTVNGKEINASTHEISSVGQDYTISATFKKKTSVGKKFTVGFMFADGGSDNARAEIRWMEGGEEHKITRGEVDLPAGTRVELWVFPNSGYRVKELQLNYVKQDYWEGAPFVIESLSAWSSFRITLAEVAPGFTPVQVTVTFNANGGTGTMDAVTVEKGSQYTLPECKFTAPEGKEFDKWDQGAVGTKITVTEDVTVKALWRKKSDPSPAVAVEGEGRVAITLSPNPVRDVLRISGLSGRGVAQIFRPDGALVASVAIDTNGLIRVEGLSQGLYLLRVDGVVLRFVKI